jgi:DNA mismatch endonuclease (patch repair protein)
MRQIRSTNTLPERTIRSLLHSLGFRFRLYRKDLPGKPDVVLPKYRTAVFLHGCFWHRHPACSRTTTPAVNQDYWLPKFERTIERDRRTQAELRALGWNVVLVWECELKNIGVLKSRLITAITRGMPTHHPERVPLFLAGEGQSVCQTVPAKNQAKRPTRK